MLVHLNVILNLLLNLNLTEICIHNYIPTYPIYVYRCKGSEVISGLFFCVE